MIRRVMTVLVLHIKSSVAAEFATWWVNSFFQKKVTKKYYQPMKFQEILWLTKRFMITSVKL